MSCWDLNENYFCDLETEDKNNDNMCDVLDCQASPGEGNGKVYSANSSYLGLLIDSAPIEAGDLVPPSITVYVPDLKKLFQVSTGYFGENIYEPIPYRQNGNQLEYVYFDGESCSGNPYILPGDLYINERFQMLYHIVTYIHLNRDVKHYDVIYNSDEVISIISRHRLIGNTCENYQQDSKGLYELNEVNLPFPYPVELPLSFK